MASPNSPQNPADSEVPKRLDPIEIERINGVRKKITSILKKTVVVLGLSSVAGGIVGTMVQGKYREAMGSHPDQKVETPETQPEKPKGWFGGLREKAKDNELLQKAQEVYGKAERWAGKKVEGIEWVQEYRELVRDYQRSYSEFQEMKRKMEDWGDKAAFWLPFSIVFLATAMLAGKICQLHKSLTQKVDPAVEEALNRLVQSGNKEREAINGLIQGRAKVEELEKRVREKSEAYDQVLAQLEAAKAQAVKNEKAWEDRMNDLLTQFGQMEYSVQAMSTEIENLRSRIDPPKKEGEGN